MEKIKMYNSDIKTIQHLVNSIENNQASAEEFYFTFMMMLEKFVIECGLDRIDECNIANLLLNKLNDK